MPACSHAAIRRAAIALGLLLGCASMAAPAAVAAEPERPAPALATAAAPPSPPATARTGKERMGGKAMDEQRLDDCKVPPERRTRPRPTACPGEAGR